MTALNAFCDDHCAYFATDGALYDGEHDTYLGSIQKAAMFVDQRLVIATCGTVLVSNLIEALREVHCTATYATQASLLAAIPDAMRLCRDRARSNIVAERLGINTVGVLIGAFNLRSGAPAIYWANSEDYPGADANAAYTLQPMPGGYAMPAPGADAEAELCPNGYWEDAEQHMRGLLLAQRRGQVRATGRSNVGGECTMFRINARGIEYRSLFDFNDKPGEQMRLPTGSSMPPKSHSRWQSGAGAGVTAI